MASSAIRPSDARRLEDRARIEYVRRAYGVDGMDPALYHLMLDSTALSLDACVELIVAASQARRKAHGQARELDAGAARHPDTRAQVAGRPVALRPRP